jgi:hypothetical protein
MNTLTNDRRANDATLEGVSTRCGSVRHDQGLCAARGDAAGCCPDYETAYESAIGFDPVIRPKHYTTGKVECIDAIESAISELKGREALLTGQCIKYLWRWKKKENPKQDLEKALWYLKRLLKAVEAPCE